MRGAHVAFCGVAVVAGSDVVPLLCKGGFFLFLGVMGLYGAAATPGCELFEAGESGLQSSGFQLGYKMLKIRLIVFRKRGIRVQSRLFLLRG